ncbi:hypothetical protein BDN71DRAFT_1451295 [Pleurotus eryngii]|uniref:Rhodopsin domain-containing protein n=1 Tax=Pleurotus eryngii TaxID=5323 RepID=A0A9P5ZS94_PLEER|nr:hypothetical protein BDN71DRAFT_1451295 [Pleurotus eryngii]
MGLPTPDISMAKGLISIPHSIALCATVFRSYERWRMGRLWWDDYWAMIALFFDIPNWLAFLLRPPDGSGERFLSIESRVGISWVGLICFPLTVWSARISIGVSSVRILPPGRMMRKVAFYMNVLFGLMCAGLLIYRGYSCGHDSSWHRNPGVQCFFPHNVGVYNLTTDIIADIMLIAIPLKMLWNVKLTYNLRPVVLSVFTASIFTTLASIVYVTFMFRAPRWERRLAILVTIMSHLEATTALIVCNLLVLVTHFYRVYRNGQDIESYYPSSRSQPPSHELRIRHLTGIPRRSEVGRYINTNQGQTITASVHFTEITGDISLGSDYYYDSSISGGTLAGEKSTQLPPITQ